MKLRRSLYAHSKPFPRGAPWRGFMLRSAPLVALSAASVCVRHLSNWSRGRPVSMACAHRRCPRDRPGRRLWVQRGGAVALHLAINHPELVRKLIVSSASFHPDGGRQENKEAMEALTVDAVAGTPLEQDYRAKSPNPDKLQELLDKLGRFDAGFTG